MSDSKQNDKLFAEIPAELHDWYYTEIDSLLEESRRVINSDVYPFKAEKKGYILPLVINLAIALFTLIIFITVFAVLNSREKHIISNYTYLLSVEGRILSEYRQETEKKLDDLNGQISAVESRLRGVTDEKNRLQNEMDIRIEGVRSQLLLEMQEALAAERIRLREQGLSAADIENRISQLEQARTKELEESQRQLRQQLEQEYENKQAANLARLNEYEQILARNREEKSRLEAELQQTNEQIKTLTSKSSRTVAAESNPRTGSDTADASGTALAAAKKEQLVADQINALYRKINSAVAAGDLEAADAAVGELSDYLKLDTVASLTAVKNRSEGDRQALRTFKTMIALQKSASAGAPEQPPDPHGEAAEIPSEILSRSEKLKSLQSLVKGAEGNAKTYYSKTRGTEGIKDVVEHLEVKQLVREILSSEPVASEHPGLADKLDQYYAALGDAKMTAGQLIALQNINDLLEKLDASSSSLPESWKQIKNEEIRYSLLQLIRELETVLE